MVAQSLPHARGVMTRGAAERLAAGGRTQAMAAGQAEAACPTQAGTVKNRAKIGVSGFWAAGGRGWCVAAVVPPGWLQGGVGGGGSEASSGLRRKRGANGALRTSQPCTLLPACHVAHLGGAKI